MDDPQRLIDRAQESGGQASIAFAEGEQASPAFTSILSKEDVLATMSYLVQLAESGADATFYHSDDIDHFGNRRLRSVGELIQNQVRIGLSRMERVVRERMTTQDVEAITPQTLINIRPVVASIQGVLRRLPAVAVHGPDQPALGAHAQAQALGPRAGWALA